MISRWEIKTRLLAAWHALCGHSVAFKLEIRNGRVVLKDPRGGEWGVTYPYVVSDKPGPGDGVSWHGSRSTWSCGDGIGQNLRGQSETFRMPTAEKIADFSIAIAISRGRSDEEVA